MYIYKKGVRILIVFLFSLFFISFSIAEGVVLKGKLITLPKPILKGTMSLEETLLLRRSKRAFYNKNLNITQISQLLWASQGITEDSTGFRTSPSAGATYPLEVYLLSWEGIYHYIPNGHKLELVKNGDYRKHLASACFGQPYPEIAPLNFIISAVYSRTSKRYGLRAIMYVHLEAGHSAQNILLQAVALGLGGVPIGAFDEGSLGNILKLPKDCSPLYVIPVGYPK